MWYASSLNTFSVSEMTQADLTFIIQGTENLLVMARPACLVKNDSKSWPVSTQVPTVLWVNHYLHLLAIETEVQTEVSYQRIADNQ